MPRKGRACRRSIPKGEQPLPNTPPVRVTAEVTCGGDGWEVVGELTTYSCRREMRPLFRRIARALFAYQAAAREFVLEMGRREREGLDPLAGMEPVEVTCLETNDAGQLRYPAARPPRFVAFAAC